MVDPQQIIFVEQIEPLILEMRGQKVLLDRDLARRYGVPTKRLNEQVRRNRDRFPEDYLFQLSQEELDTWRSQFATSNPAARMGRRRRPLAFTEHGAIRAPTVLNSARAVEVSVFVVPAFIKLRQLALSHKELAARLEELERRVAGPDDSIRQLVSAIRQLMAPAPEKPKERIGFRGGGEEGMQARQRRGAPG